MWLKPQMESSVGLDMTSATLRAVKLTKTKEGFRLDRTVTETARETSYEGRQEALFRVIDALKAESGMKNVQFRISMSTSEATVKYLTLPHLLDDELENAIKLQVDAETAGSPYPLSAQHFIADRNAAGVRVGLVLFPKQTLHSLVEYCRSLETPLDGIEVEAASYFTTCTSSEQIPDTGAAVLDLRGDAFNLHVLGKLSPAFSRSVPVSSVWNAKPQDVAHAGAEPPVQGIPSPGHPTGTHTPVAPGRPDAQAGVSPSPARTCAFSALGIRSLAKEIHDTLQYLEFELRGSQVTKLILAGDMSRQDGLDRRLGLALGISVEALRLPSFLSPEAAGGTDPRLFGIALGASYGAF